MTEHPKRKKRADSFFGLHFDFHARPSGGKDTIPIGKTITEEMIHHVIDAAGPDYIQIDCKGHPGWSSYPTKTGNPYPLISKDILGIWRKVTAERGVSLFMHYSGVVDEFQCEKNPRWKRVSVEGDGTPEWVPDGITSTFSPYVDEVVIPQMLELAGEYGVDGIWVDGECWGTQTEYSMEAMNAFFKETGIDIRDDPPKKPGDMYWYEYSEFCREQFRRYLRKYTDKVHDSFPDFQIASNWAFSSKMPEKVSVDVDFLSGDYLWADSVNSARYEGRCLASQGLPWDLMAWGFRWRHGDKMERCPKHPEQLKQEAAVVMALGGGFQSYFPQKKDGSIHIWQVELMKPVADFCREREPYCHKASFIPQIAVLNSTYDRYKRSRYLFQCEGEDGALQGIVQLLCESNQTFEILSEHSIRERLGEYPLVILPETENLSEDFIQLLAEYVEKGGSLLLVGNGPCDVFCGMTKMEFRRKTDDFLISADNTTWAYNSGTVIIPTDAPKTGGRLATLSEIDEGKGYHAWAIDDFGHGKIGYILTDIGRIYLTRKSHVHRQIIKDVLNELFKPDVMIKGSMYIDVTFMKKNGSKMINLVNTAGSHDDQDVFTIDEIPEPGPVYITVRCQKPGSVLLQPGNKPVDFIYIEKDGCIHATVPKVKIHEILEIKPPVS